MRVCFECFFEVGPGLIEFAVLNKLATPALINEGLPLSDFWVVGETGLESLNNGDRSRQASAFDQVFELTVGVKFEFLVSEGEFGVNSGVGRGFWGMGW